MATTKRLKTTIVPLVRKIWSLCCCIVSLIALLGTVSRLLPSELQSLPYMPVVVVFGVWYMLLAVVVLLVSAVTKRWCSVVLCILTIANQIFFQYPFFVPSVHLPQQAVQAVSAQKPNLHDTYARVMTCNVYKGKADARAIVQLVKEQRVEILALQEISADFVRALHKAGIGRYLPHEHIAAVASGGYGSGLWTAAGFEHHRREDVQVGQLTMPAVTLTFGSSQKRVRFVSVHTTSPVPGFWRQWSRSLENLGEQSYDTTVRYVWLGDFNATLEHSVFREFLGKRFTDAAKQSGHGFTFTWPADKAGLIPMFAIDHIVLDQGMVAGQVQTATIAHSDHMALLATVSFG